MPADLEGSAAAAGSLDNPAISGLYCHVGYSVDPDFKELGTVEDRWSRKVGTVLVLRRDRDDIDVNRVRTLCELCRSKVVPLAKASRESQIDVDEVHDWIREEIAPLLPQ